jgi:hypothetical protein
MSSYTQMSLSKRPISTEEKSAVPMKYPFGITGSLMSCLTYHILQIILGECVCVHVHCTCAQAWICIRIQVEQKHIILLKEAHVKSHYSVLQHNACTETFCSTVCGGLEAFTSAHSFTQQQLYPQRNSRMVGGGGVQRKITAVWLYPVAHPTASHYTMWAYFWILAISLFIVELCPWGQYITIKSHSRGFLSNLSIVCVRACGYTCTRTHKSFQLSSLLPCKTQD